MRAMRIKVIYHGPHQARSAMVDIRVLSLPKEVDAEKLFILLCKERSEDQCSAMLNANLKEITC